MSREFLVISIHPLFVYMYFSTIYSRNAKGLKEYFYNEKFFLLGSINYNFFKQHVVLMERDQMQFNER